MAKIEMTGNASTKITLRLIELNASSTYPTMKIKLNGVTKNLTKSSGSTVSGAVEFSSLSPDSSYLAEWNIVSGGGTPASGTGTFYTTPNQVTNVTASSITTSSASVSWSLSGTATDYRVVLRRGSSSGSAVSTEYPSSKSQSFTGLSSNTTYYVGVVARNVKGHEGNSGSTTFTTKASAPSYPTISSVSSNKNSVTFSWGSVSGATGYTVKLMDEYGYSLSTATTTSTSYTFSSLSGGTWYQVAVLATNSGGNSSYSSSRSIETRPSDMGSVSVTTTSTTFKGSWTNATAYQFRVVLRKGSTSSGDLVKEVYTYNSEYTFTGLTPNTQYYFGVEPFNESGVSGVSGSMYAYTKAQSPNKPTISSVTSTKNSVTFSWGSVSGATGYTVKLMNKSGTQLNTYSTTSTSYTFSSLSGGTWYQVAVLATNSGGNSSYSNSSSIETRPADMGDVGVTTTSTTFKGLWANATATSFRVVLRKGSTSSGALVGEDTTTSSNYTFTGLTPNTQYYFGVEPFNESGVSGVSGSMYAYTKEAPPSIPVVSSTLSSTRDSITFSWGSVSNATNYTVRLLNDSGTVIKTDTTTSTSYTFSGLSSGTFYRVTVRSNNSLDSSAYANVRRKETRPSPMGDIGVSSTTTTFTGSWTNTTASSFRVVLRRGSTANGSLVGEATTTGNSYTFTGLTENAEYYFGVEPLNESGESGTSGSGTTYTKVSPPTTITILDENVATTSIKVSFAGGASSGYTLRTYRVSSGALISTITGTTSPLSVTGLSEYVEYRFELTNKNYKGVESTAKTLTRRTKDGTKPTVTITNTVSEGAMKIEWTASDAHSGLRTTSTYLVSITSNGGTTYVSKDYTTNKYYTFTSDANGNEFVNNGTYYMRVTAYDAQGNTATTTSGAVVYKRARPNDWNWHTAKTKGSALKVTADEWNSFCTRLNQFRQYKRLDNFSFTEAKKGNPITSVIYNQAVNAISEMPQSVSTTMPSIVSKGTVIKASHFNLLTNAMNSIP